MVLPALCSGNYSLGIAAGHSCHQVPINSAVIYVVSTVRVSVINDHDKAVTIEAKFTLPSRVEQTVHEVCLNSQMVPVRESLIIAWLRMICNALNHQIPLTAQRTVNARAR